MTGRAAAALVVAVSLVVATPPSTFATEPVVAEHMPEVAEHTARGGATPIPDVACDVECEGWWLEEHQASANTSARAALNLELRTLRSKAAKVLPRLGRFGGAQLAGQVAAELGWRIGVQGAKFLRIGLPPGSGDSDVTGQSISFREQGSSLYWAGMADHVMPFDGWLWTFSTYSGNFGHWFDYSSPGADKCSQFSFTPPPDFEVHVTPNVNQCFRGYFEDPPAAPVGGVSAVLPEDALKANGPIEDYSGQPFDLETLDWPDQPTTKTQLEDRVRDALDSGEYPLLDLWYAYLSDPDNYADPLTSEQENHRCDLDDPAYKNPGGSADPEPLAVKDPVPYQTTGRPSGSEGAPDPYLRWGRASWASDYLDNWDGWGWRHIRAKHGWTTGPGTTDETATRSTLASPVLTVEQNPTSMRYAGPQVERNGALCSRVVVVEYAPKDGDTEPYGIITSFERFDGDA